MDDLLLLQIFLLIYNANPRTYLVGGCVRDMLLGRKPKDYDIVTEANIDELRPTLIENGWQVDVVGDVPHLWPQGHEGHDHLLFR